MHGGCIVQNEKSQGMSLLAMQLLPRKAGRQLIAMEYCIFG